MWSLCVSFQTGPLCKDIMMMITKKQTNKTTDVPAELRRETVLTNTVYLFKVIDITLEQG